MVLSDLFVGKPGIPVLMDVDDPAALKAQLSEQPLHHRVVCVGVDAQVAALRKGPVEAKGAHALFGAVRGDPVDHAVGAVFPPRPSISR